LPQNLNIKKGNVSMSDCLFCKIIEGKIPSNKVYEDENILCFHDIAPQAPVHVLILPKKHIASMDELSAEDGELIANLLIKIKDIAAQLELENGYRVVNNCGEDGMQTVAHLHFHLLGQRQMEWPPG
jgi:diadenosine tetraphosphate (Ap4A) HIT family hydrolase